MENIDVKFSSVNYGNKRVETNFYTYKTNNITYRSNFIESQKEHKKSNYVIKKDCRVFDE